MNLRRRTLLVPVLLAGVTATLAVAQDNSSHSSRSDRSEHSDRSDRSSRSDRSDRDSRRSERDSRSRSGSSYSSSFSSSTTQPSTFLDGYRLVLDRNIFSRSRVIYREASASPTTAPSGSYRSLPALSLTGVTKEGGAATAFIEDRRSSTTTFHHIGDAIADGKLTAINLDSIEYVTAAGRTVRVELGQPLETGPTYTISSSSSSSFGPSSYSSSGGSSSGVTPTPSGSPGASPAAPASSGDPNDILERLRQKRLQETKR